MDTSSLRKVAIDSILDKIRHSELKADDIISEAQVGESLNISRTPVREALIELTASGVLRKVPRKGYAVNKIDNKHKLDTYEILAAMDALAASLALPHMREQDILQLHEAVDQMNIAIKYKNYPSYCDLQDKFHNIYIRKCDNQQLIQFITTIKSSVDRYTYYSDDIERLFEICSIANEEHEKIVTLFEEKDKHQLEFFLKNNHWQTKYEDMI